MNQSNGFRQQLVVWGVVLCVWAALVLAFTAQLVFTNSMPWNEAIWISLRDWLPWGFLSPLVAGLAFLFPFERGRLRWSIPAHILGCIIAVVVCELLAPAGPQPQNRFPGGTPQERFRQNPASAPPEDGAAFPRGPGQPQGFPPEGAPPGGGPPPFGAGDRRPLLANARPMRARFNLAVYFVIVSIVQAFNQFRRTQERERKAAELEARLAQAKLQALRMQLHPHFLFNTLNAISTLVHKDPHAADEMIVNLSELLRAALDTTNDQEVSLRRELEFLDRYLEIQQVRFGDRLRVEKLVDAAALDGKVPTLILQPLVENAIKHGIEPQTNSGLIEIGAWRREDRLRLRVHNNGVPIRAVARESMGIGLANTKARLEELYGSGGQILLTSGADGGFTVEMEIPYHDENTHAHS